MFAQYLNASESIFVTLLGTVTAFSALHPWNVRNPMVATPSGSVMAARAVQPQNAWLPMLVTPDWMVAVLMFK
jgi:hypothetical protein